MSNAEFSESPEYKAEQFRRGVLKVLDLMFTPDVISGYGEVIENGAVRYRSWGYEERAYHADVTYTNDTREAVESVSLRTLDLIFEDLRSVRYYYYEPATNRLSVSDDNLLTLGEALGMNGNLPTLNPLNSPHELVVAHGVMRADELLRADFLEDLDSFPRLVGN